MPAQIPRPEIMDEDQLMKEVLDKFINCPEQTYEEFLSTFTHLSKENNVARRGACGADLSENIFTTKKLTHKKESHGHHFRNTAVIPHTSSECSEDDQIVIDEGQQVGSSLQGDMTQAGKVKVDNFLGLEDLDMEEESEPQMNKGKQLKTRQTEHLPALFSSSSGGVRPGRTTTSPSKRRGVRPGRTTTSLSKRRGVRPGRTTTSLSKRRGVRPGRTTTSPSKRRGVRPGRIITSFSKQRGVRPGRTTTSPSKRRGVRPGRTTTSLSKQRGVRPGRTTTSPSKRRGVRPGRIITSFSKQRGVRPGRTTTSPSKRRGVRLEGSSLPMPSSNLPDGLQPCNMIRSQHTDRLLLPGEVEQDISASVPAYVPSVNLPLTPEVKPKPTVQRTLKQMEEIFGDEVQPFFLDEEFDYDNVTLTPKFTAGEIASIQELAKQKMMDTSTDFCEHHD